MTIIAVNRFYAPDHSATSQLLTDLAEHLVAQGEQVTIITSRLIYDDPNQRLSSRETINGVNVRRIWTSGFGRTHLLGRAVDYLSFYASAIFAMLAEVRRGDVLLAKTDPPMISVPVAIVARLKGARLVNWCQDLFPEIAAALDMRWAKGLVGKSLQLIRNWSLRQARFNVVLCDEMRSKLLGEGIDSNRIKIVHNWCERSIKPYPPNKHSNFVVGYSGNLGRAHCAEAILDLVQRCAADRQLCHLHWRFTGGGGGWEFLKRSLPKELADRVEFQSYRPRSELGRSLASCDLHLITLDPRCEGLIMPSKLYGILAVNRRVIFLGSPKSAVARIIVERGCGINLPSNHPHLWNSLLADFLEDNSYGESPQSCANQAATSLDIWVKVLRNCSMTSSLISSSASVAE